MKRGNHIDLLLEKWRNIEAGTYETTPQKTANPERVRLYGGIAGLSMSIPEMTLCDGLVVRSTYAHVMAPYLMAFKRPKGPGSPHPPPWKATRGGLGFDITVEVALAEASRPTGLDRLNTLWWVLALLRLKTGAPIRMPVVSDMAYAAIALNTEEPNLWTIEMPPRQIATSRNPPNEIHSEHLKWVRDRLISGSHLLENEAFNRAFQTFDSAIWAHTPSSAIVMAWASLETLFRPGRNKITKTLASSIATYLHEPGPERDRAYQQIEQLYGARGSSVHDGQVPESEQILGSFALARRSLSISLETQRLPNCEELLTKWKRRL